jgi:hypothetical protein
MAAMNKTQVYRWHECGCALIMNSAVTNAQGVIHYELIPEE